jgi:phosphoribosyl-AMP cyclohydrolase
MNPADELRLNDDGLIPAIAQDRETGRVLMMAWMNTEAFEKTLETGYAHYYSRSRQCLWKKGETSGHLQRVVEVHLDCDGDALLLQVEQTGPACHTNRPSCFYRKLDKEGVWKITEEPVA